MKCTIAPWCLAEDGHDAACVLVTQLIVFRQALAPFARYAAALHPVIPGEPRLSDGGTMAICYDANNPNGPEAKLTFEDLRHAASALRWTPAGPLPSPPAARWTVSGYLTREDRVLLVHHKRLDMWVPIGGGIKPGERPIEALLREVFEETRFEITDVEYLGYDEHIAGKRAHLNHAYRARVLTQGEPCSNGEWDRHVWMPFGEEPPPSIPRNVRAVLRKFGDPKAASPDGLSRRAVLRWLDLYAQREAGLGDEERTILVEAAFVLGSQIDEGEEG